MLRALGLALALSCALILAGATAASAQSIVADPEDFAIMPSELPPGFTYDPDETTREEIPGGIGTAYKAALEREPTPENRASGPIVISQVIFRIDHLVVPTDFFTEVRDRVAREQDLQLDAAAPQSATTSYLVKRGEHEGEPVVLYGIGTVRDNFVFFTFLGGTEPATSLETATQLANISTDKYEALKSAPPVVQAEYLYRALLRTPFAAPHLHDKFGVPRVSSGEPGERATGHAVIGEVDVDFDEGATIGNLTFLVYPSEVEAAAAFEVARTQPRGTILGEFTPAGVAGPVYCATSVGVSGGRPMGASACLARMGNVEIGAFTAVQGETSGDEAGTIEILRAGLQHLQRLIG